VIRAGLRLLVLVVWALVAIPFPIVLWVVTLGSASVRARTGPWLFVWFARGICLVLGIRVTATGERPPRGCLVAPNHTGYVDILVLGSLDPATFVSMANVARWPVIGLFAQAGGTLFIRREVRRDAVRVRGEVERRLRMGNRVTVFLEGGAGDGSVVRPFKSALVSAAVAAGAPCVPVALTYAVPGGDPRTDVAWTTQAFGAHAMRLLSLRRVEARVTFLGPRTGANRKEIARDAEGSVRAVVEGAAPATGV
jgi:1-acyl-sn-glycerol-3-phosphate acyltransferase